MVLKQFIRFGSDAAGLEKLLRLLQSLCQILAAYALVADEVRVWMLLRRQFGVGRRFLRFFRWVGCFEKAWACFMESGEGRGIKMLLEVGRWGFLGLYMGLESATILDTLLVRTTSFGEMCTLEGNKFWFYSLVCSIAWGVWEVWGTYGEMEVVEKGKEEEVEVEKRLANMKTARGAKRKRIVLKIVSDGFDLFVPGHVTGWIATSPATAGMASVVSTLLSSRDIWERMVQSS